jgi:hypothetical protein
VAVAYRIECDGKLEASNQIIFNQLTLGPKWDSPDATKLLGPLLVALLRARTVRDALIAQGLGSERLFLGDAKLHTDAGDAAPWVPQAQLTLSVR